MPARANCAAEVGRVVSTPLPPPMHSSARKRQPTGKSLADRAAHLRNTSSGRRMRFSTGAAVAVLRVVMGARGTRPSCRRARSAARRRRSRPRGRGGRRGEQRRQRLRQLADVSCVRVGHALASAELAAPRARAARGSRPAARTASDDQPGAHLRIGRAACARRRRGAARQIVRNSRRKRVGLRAAADRQEVDQLDEEARLAVARLAHHAHELAQSGEEAVVADAQQRAAGHVADAGRLDHECPGTPAREAAIPVEHLGGDEAVLGRAPRHHRRHPGALVAGRRLPTRTGEKRRERCRLRGARPAGRAADRAGCARVAATCGI